MKWEQFHTLTATQKYKLFSIIGTWLELREELNRDQLTFAKSMVKEQTTILKD